MAKIFINPGHAPNGNPDPGACGEFLRESDVAAFVGDVVAKDLQAVGYETKVFQSDELGEICRVANAWGADYFISIHLNSAENRSAKGTETFYYVGSPSSEKLARDPIIRGFDNDDFTIQRDKRILDRFKVFISILPESNASFNFIFDYRNVAAVNGSPVEVDLLIGQRLIIDSVEVNANDTFFISTDSLTGLSETMLQVGD